MPVRACTEQSSNRARTSHAARCQGTQRVAVTVQGEIAALKCRGEQERWGHKSWDREEVGGGWGNVPDESGCCVCGSAALDKIDRSRSQDIPEQTGP